MSTNDRVPRPRAQEQSARFGGLRRNYLEARPRWRRRVSDAERETCECMSCAWRRRWGERESAEFAAFEAGRATNSSRSSDVTTTGIPRGPRHGYRFR